MIAEKKITEGKICNASTNPIDCVPSDKNSPGPIANGPNKKTDPFCDACNKDMRVVFIHSRAFRVPGSQKVIPPIDQAKKILPAMVFLFNRSLFPVTQAIKEIMKNPVKATPLYVISSIKLFF